MSTAAILDTINPTNTTTRAARLPTSASQTLYSRREAEVGSPSKDLLAAPSESVILLTWEHGKGCVIGAF